MSLGPSSSAAEVLAHLQALRSEAAIAGMARFGIVTETALGISTPALRRIAKTIRRNHARAKTLFESGIREARLLAAFTEEPHLITKVEAETIIAALNSWELVDSWADTLGHTDLSAELIPACAADEREFVRRMGFTLIAWTAVHRKTLPDADILAYLPLIESHATDPRNFVRKAVNWALRQIGKRNPACHAPALTLATTLAASTDRTARWIGKDAVRELNAVSARWKVEG